jgi:hypothetical protein
MVLLDVAAFFVCPYSVWMKFLFYERQFQIMFPSTLLGTGEKWTMMKTISVTEYLNYEAGM